MKEMGELLCLICGASVPDSSIDRSGIIDGHMKEYHLSLYVWGKLESSLTHPFKISGLLKEEWPNVGGKITEYSEREE
jgi:hypothetical protein